MTKIIEEINKEFEGHWASPDSDRARPFDVQQIQEFLNDAIRSVLVELDSLDWHNNEQCWEVKGLLQELKKYDND